MVLKRGFRSVVSYTMPVLYCCLLFGITSCSVLKENGRYELETGKFISSVTNVKRKSWVHFEDTVIWITPIQNAHGIKTAFFFSEISDTGNSILSLSKSTFDLDVITIPFKYRPSIKEFPNQLTTNFSGALYTGYRNDFYKFHYRKNALGKNRRKLNHFGFSIGVFTGIGSSAINSSVTLNRLSAEYDGFLLMNGIAGLIAINKITFGAGVGIDQLLDKNRTIWIYYQKPWIGLTVGLNLN